MVIRILAHFLILLTPGLALAQSSLAPAIELGYGMTASRNRSGEATSGQVSAAVARWSDLELRGELFYQGGTVGGAGKCERLGEQHCIGTSDRNRIGGLSASLHIPLGVRSGITAYVPLGVGLYTRRTRTTETEGPIAICTENGQLVPCPGNPPLRSVSYDTSAIAPGYNLGFGLMTDVSRLKLYLEVRAHDLLESDSMAGALPVSVGIRF